jgi:hypothetical protein
MVERLGPEDFVAVLSFDTHLKLWCDFSGDRETLDRILRHDVIYEERARYVEPAPGPSLAYHLGLEASRRCGHPGDGLAPRRGGAPRGGWLQDDEALRAFLEAGVAVFTLDVTDADRHSLEVELRRIADETGGLYARTHVFTHQAVSRLEEALEGHYVLEVVHPGGPRGRHTLDVDLADRPGRVLARKAYFD